MILKEKYIQPIKATSYYINLAKDKFELVSEKYSLSDYGKY